jgi:predicted nuclease of predicted toxin-antitoxin system
MTLYVDEDLASDELRDRLRNAGFQVMTVRENGQSNTHDAVILRTAIERDWVVLTRNVKDFRALHQLVLASGGQHPGVLFVHGEQNTSRNMKPMEVVTAIQKLISRRLPLVGETYDLNTMR